ncbi:hypothetical protein ACSQ67_021772 [Phaseolus vulgaris]
MIIMNSTTTLTEARTMGRNYMKHEAFPREEKKERDAKKVEKMATEDINASADAFIKNFRHHLLLQSLQSIDNHREH